MYAGVSLLLLFFYYCAYGFCKLISTMITNIFTFLLPWNIFSLKSFGFPCSPFLFKGTWFLFPIQKKKTWFLFHICLSGFFVLLPSSAIPDTSQSLPLPPKEERKKKKDQERNFQYGLLCFVC